MNVLILRSRKKSKDTQNLWGTAKAAIRGQFIAMQAYFKKQGKSQINNLSFRLKKLEKEQQAKPKVIGGSKHKDQSQK